MTRVCTRCLASLPIARFATIRTAGKSRYHSWCNGCRAEYRDAYRLSRKPPAPVHKRCLSCARNRRDVSGDNLCRECSARHRREAEAQGARMCVGCGGVHPLTSEWWIVDKAGAIIESHRCRKWLESDSFRRSTANTLNRRTPDIAHYQTYLAQR